MWAPDGRTLYFRSGDDLMAASVTEEPDFTVLGQQRVPVDLGEMASALFSASYDVHPDGSHFVFFRGQDDGGGFDPDAALNVLTNWFTELRERMGEER
jgi:hypothetical protein